MNKEDKLFLFGGMGVLANIVFNIVFDFIDFYLWDAWLYGNGAYPYFLYNYGYLITDANFILFLFFLGFTVGVALSWMAREEGK